MMSSQMFTKRGQRPHKNIRTEQRNDADWNFSTVATNESQVGFAFRWTIDTVNDARSIFSGG